MVVALHKNIVDNAESLENLISLTWEDDIPYRFYHQSFKVYYEAQGFSEKAKALFDKIAPEGASYSPFFLEIFSEGTGHVFSQDHNAEWTKHTRPILECYFHCNYFVKEMIRASKAQDPFNGLLESGYAAILCLYNLR